MDLFAEHIFFPSNSSSITNLWNNFCSSNPRTRKPKKTSLSRHPKTHNKTWHHSPSKETLQFVLPSTVTVDIRHWAARTSVLEVEIGDYWWCFQSVFFFCLNILRKLFVPSWPVVIYFGSFQNVILLMYPPRKLRWRWKIHHLKFDIWRCISYGTSGFSNVMLVFRGVLFGMFSWFCKTYKFGKRNLGGLVFLREISVSLWANGWYNLEAVESRWMHEPRNERNEWMDEGMNG